MNNLKSIIDKLKSSPIFNLSLGNKELFHSNFWYWLCIIYPETMCSIFKNIFLELNNMKAISLLESAHSIKKVKREKEKIDLSITFDNDIVLNVENKTKSIAYISQLEKYSAKESPNNIFLLISLSESDIKTKNWESTTYKYFINSFESIWTQDSTKLPQNPYYEFLLRDYICYVKLLDEIIDELFYNKLFLDKKYGEFEAELKKFKEIRFDDLLFKLMFEHLMKHLKLKLERENNFTIVDEFSSNETIESTNTKIQLSVGMTRSTPYLDVEILKDVDLKYRVQLQGNTLKLMITLKDDNNWESEIKNKGGDYLIFDKYVDLLNKRKKEHKKKYKDYYSYKNKFNFDLYKCIEIGKEVSFSEIINILIVYITKMNNIKSKN